MLTPYKGTATIHGLNCKLAVPGAGYHPGEPEIRPPRCKSHSKVMWPGLNEM